MELRNQRRLMTGTSTQRTQEHEKAVLVVHA